MIKDAEALERMAKVDVLVVDKTGTLTEGKPKLTDVVSFGQTTELDMLALVRGIAFGSDSIPLAEAIVEGIAGRKIAAASVTDFDSVTGKGVSGKSGGQKIALGNAAMMEFVGATTADADEQANALRTEGKTAMYVAINGELAGLDCRRRTPSRQPPARRSSPFTSWA